MALKKTALKPKSTPASTEQPGTELSKNNQFPIVGVGASAGGLEAFTQLFKHLPADPGMAFVLIQHLAPAHESMLTELLSKATSMPVREVKDGMTVAPDNVYIIPPDKEMVISQGVLHLMPRDEVKGQYMPVDSFLRSLAQDRRNNAMAVILSGTGSDGSMGVRAVKGEGGIVFAQDETAKYDGMPKSAFDTGYVDFVLPPDKIAAELLRLRRHPYPAAARDRESAQIVPEEKNGLNRIFIMLRSAKGIDFTSYKRPTIMRRINRRMLLQKIEGMESYITYLKETPSEIETLYQDILINVTSFFREPKAFEALKKSVFPHIVNRKSVDDPVRIWVPACSTGEEAYSIAIALVEYMDENKISRSVQVFATDIDDLAVEKARKGIYPENISRDVSPERLRRFFEKNDGGYVISKFVREMCIFAKQNIVKDPPFSKIDLISCRNVLIYFGPELQKKAISILFYALSPKGFLMIGPSETVGEFAGLFSVADKKNTIYAKKAEQSSPNSGAASAEYGKEKMVGKKTDVQPGGVFDIQKEADNIVLTKYSPAGFVVSEGMKILQFRGDTGPYLRPAQGEASLDLMKMVSEDLVAELRTALHQAKKEDISVRKDRVRVKRDKRINHINIYVVPFKAPASGERCFLVMFEETGKFTQPRRGDSRIAPTDETLQLGQELAESKAHLNTVISEYEGANEELRALNEELQSSNEEMQSINEEMETAKEELQSTNEELTTVNDELRSRNEEASQLNNDLSNVLRGVGIPIIILGSELQIRRFNDAAARLMNLIPSDTGRPLSDIRTNINIPDLEQMVLDVINNLTVKEKEVKDIEGRWYSMTIRQYRTVDNRIDGVLMTLVDVDDMKRNLLRVEGAYDYANAIVETVREPLLVLDSSLKVITANKSFYANFLVTPEETENKSIYDLGDRRWNIPALHDLLEKTLSEDKALSDLEVELELPNIGHMAMIINASKIYLKEPYFKAVLNRMEHFDRLVLLALEDITERKKIEDAQLFLVRSGWVASGEDFFKSLARYLAENLGMDFVCIDRLEGEGLSAQTVAVYFNGKFEDNVSYTLKDTPCGDVVGKTICSFPEGVRHLYPQDIILQEMLAESYVGTTLWSSTGQPIGLIAIIGRKPLVNPQSAELMLRMVSVRAAGELERRQAEEALSKAHEELERRSAELELVNKELEVFSYTVSHDLKEPLRSIQGFSLAITEDYTDKLDDTGKDFLRRINSAGEKMTQLIEAMMEISRLTSRDLTESSVNLSSIAEVIAYELRKNEPERKVGIFITKEVRAHGDSVLMEIVLRNLLDNALKFTARHTSAKIEFGVTRMDNENVYFVSDDGAGFSMEFAEKLFQPFKRLHSESEFPGLGIGLATVAKIIRKHGGKIWAESEPEKGATFYFTLGQC